MTTGDPLTTPAVLDRMARDRPDREALITPDRVLTFAQLRREVRLAAAAMVALGVEVGDRVAIWSPNTWHWVVACLATHYAGGVVVPLNTNFTAGEATEVLARSRARLLFATDSFPGPDRVVALDRPRLPHLRHVVRVPVAAGDDRWQDFLAAGSVESALSEVDVRAAAVRPDDVADILFTSGTTGRSKGVMCAHRQSLSASAAAAQSRGMTDEDRYLCVPPFFHSYGYKVGILGCLQTGTALVIHGTFDPETVMRTIAERRVTVLPGPPALFGMLLDHPARSHHDLSSLRIVTTGGAPVPTALVERIYDELGVQTVRTGYGLTESSGFGTLSRLGDDPATVATTCGVPIAGFEIRIGEPDPNGVGEVLLRGPNVMLGYLDDPEATATVIDADGWLHTGDIGSLDEAGYLRITDRLKDMYICGGLNVYPADVEGVLARLDGVAEAAVVGVVDPRLGEVGRAFVVVSPGAHLDERAVVAHAREHLANFKVPRSVVFLDGLPRNAAGKVLKAELRTIDYTPVGPAPGANPQGLGGPPIGRVENWVADAWQVLLNIERPGRRDAFTDLGGDSAAAIEFSRMLEIQFGVSMSVDRLADCPTIAAIVADLQSGSAERRQPVVRLRSDDTGPVCLMVAGIGGHAWKFLPLAKAMTAACDMLALSLIDLREGPAGQMRDRIRAAGLAAVESAAAAGRPILLAGYSFGGMVAADLACWLLDRGVPVDRFILLDPDPLDTRVEGWNPTTTHRGADALVFVPGSPAARQLNAEIAEVSGLLQGAYLDTDVRLPATEVAWVQSREMADRHAAAVTVFGTPVGRIEKSVIDLDHFGMIEIPGVHNVARWLDHQVATTVSAPPAGGV